MSTGRPPPTGIVTKGNRGVQVEGVRILRPGQDKGITTILMPMIKRRSAFEPAIGHTNMNSRLARNLLNGQLDDAIHALICEPSTSAPDPGLLYALQATGVRLKT